MEKINVVIVDDEILAAENMVLLLDTYCPEVTITGIANSISEAVVLIRKLQPELVFLDISMPPEGTGFDLLELFPNRNFHVIFATAYEKYSMKAIKEHAFDYIVKPINYKDLVKAIEDFTAVHRNKKTIAPILHKNITIKTEGEVHIIPQNTILYCKAEGSYTAFYIENDKPLVLSKPLKYAVELLDKNLFERCHRSYLINLSKVRKIIKKEGGYVQISDDMIPIGRQHYAKIMSLF